MFDKTYIHSFKFTLFPFNMFNIQYIPKERGPRDQQVGHPHVITDFT